MSIALARRAYRIPPERLSGAARHVLIFLAISTNPKTGLCNPSNYTIAKALGINLATSKDAVRSLRSDGWVQLVKAGASPKGGKRVSAIYRVTIPDFAGSSDVLPADATGGVRHPVADDETGCLDVADRGSEPARPGVSACSDRGSDTSLKDIKGEGGAPKGAPPSESGSTKRVESDVQNADPSPPLEAGQRPTSPAEATEREGSGHDGEVGTGGKVRSAENREAIEANLAALNRDRSVALFDVGERVEYEGAIFRVASQRKGTLELQNAEGIAIYSTAKVRRTQ